MKPRLSGMAIQTLAVVYTFAGIYIGCSQSSGSKNGPVIPPVSSLQKKKTENTRNKAQETTEDDSDDTKSKDPKEKSPAQKEGGNESEEKSQNKDKSDGRDKDQTDSDEDQTDSEKNPKSDSSGKEDSDSKPSYCDKNFVDLSSKDQAMVRKSAGNRVDEEDLEKAKITNCQRDENGDITFDIDYGKNNNGFFRFRRRDRDNNLSN